MWKFSWRTSSKASRWRVGRIARLRAGDVEADDARVAPADRAFGDLDRASGLAHRGHDRAHHDRLAGRGRALLARAGSPSRIASCDLVERQAALGAQLRGDADLGVDDAVGGEVLGALGGDPGDRVALLHDAGRVVERLEVELERLAVGAAAEPRRQLVDVGGRQAGRSRTRRPGRSPSPAAGRRRGGRGAAPSGRARWCRLSASVVLASTAGADGTVVRPPTGRRAGDDAGAAVRAVHEPGEQAVVAGPRRVRARGRPRLRPRLAGRPPARHRRAAGPRPASRRGRCSPRSPARRAGCGSGRSSRATRYRHPSILLKEARHGRPPERRPADLGLGAGWQVGTSTVATASAAAPGERVDRLEETIRIAPAAHVRRAGDLRRALTTGSTTRGSSRARPAARIPLLVAAHRPRT